MSLKSDKTISGNTAKEFLENLINFFHANTPDLTLLESVSPDDSEYTGYPIYSAGAPVHGNQYICESGLNDFKSPVYFFGTSVDNVVLMITLMGKWLSFSMCHSLTAARKIGDIIDKAKLKKICPLTNIVRGSADFGSSAVGRQGLLYYTYKVHLDHSTDIYRISLQYINSDYSTCYRFKPLLTSSSTPATYYAGEEQFAVIFTRTDKGVACALNLFENLNKDATNNGTGSSFYPQGQLLYFSFNEPVEISERLYSKADPWLSTDYIADEDFFMPQWAEFLAGFVGSPYDRWDPYQFYQRIGLKHFVPAFADALGSERARSVYPDSNPNISGSNSAIKLGSPKIARYYANAVNDVNFRIMPSQFFLLPQMEKGEAFTRQIYVPCSQERGEIYLCYIPAAEESDMPKSGNIYEIGGKRFLCIYPGMCGLFARVG